MAHYSGYLTYDYPRDPERGDCLVAPNDDMKEVFIQAVLDHLPTAYKDKFYESISKSVPRAAAMKIVYDALKNGELPDVTQVKAALFEGKLPKAGH